MQPRGLRCGQLCYLCQEFSTAWPTRSCKYLIVYKVIKHNDCGQETKDENFLPKRPHRRSPHQGIRFILPCSGAGHLRRSCRNGSGTDFGADGSEGQYRRSGCQKLNLEWVNWQVLRRSCATWLQQAGVDVKDAQGNHAPQSGQHDAGCLSAVGAGSAGPGDAETDLVCRKREVSAVSFWLQLTPKCNQLQPSRLNAVCK